MMTTSVDRFFGLALLALISTSAAGCVIESSDNDDDAAGGSGGSGGTVPDPEGPIAHDANEAWPKKPTNVPTVTPAELVTACVEFATCGAEESPSTDPMTVVSFCVAELAWSAERAIPASGLLRWNERVEYYVRCVLDHPGDCEAQKSCSSGRDTAIACEEDGCKIAGNANSTVSCDGSVATVKGTFGSLTRDCARAYAECDPQSETGCTDRPFTACPEDVSTNDRCDGNIRLGCDGKGQVSYHDCSVLGGICGETNGSMDCVYQDPPDSECADSKDVLPVCDAGMLGVCLNGARVRVDAKTLCPSA